MRFSLPRCLAALTPLLLAPAAAAAADDAPGVVASIKPVHSLVAGVMDGVGTPHLFVGGGDSPHTYAMRPSDARALADADVVFWVGRELEMFLERAIDNLGHEVRSVALIEAPGLVLHEYEDDHDHGHAHDDGHGHEHDENDGHDHGHAHEDEGGHEHGHAHDNDAHDDDGHGHEHDHAQDEENEHGHEHDDHAHGHDHEHGHVHEGLDAHIWLDPANARAMVEAIVVALSETDPANADTYESNGAALIDRLSELEADIAARLEPHRDVAFFTFHEAFRYFAERFEINSRGAITVSPEVQPGAQRLIEIQAEIEAHDRVCVFAEPQFPPRLIDVVVEGTHAHSGVVDPLGADIADGPELYFELMEFNADAFATCFAETM